MEYHQQNTHHKPGDNAISHYSNYGPTFRNDIFVDDNCNTNNKLHPSTLIFPIATWTQLEKERKPSLAHGTSRFQISRCSLTERKLFLTYW